MADALVALLNSLGYQPVFLPRTGVTPPELYHYANRRLVRLGPLADRLPSAAALPTAGSGRLADIEHQHTSRKDLKATVSFLDQALRCIGITAIPKLDLSFAGAKTFSFAFSDVTYRGLDPTQLHQPLQQLSTTGIPEEYVEAGKLHVAYEYAYARRLLLSRADQKAFKHDVAGKVGAFIDLGTSGKAEVASSTTVSFTSVTDDVAAFAYKAGRLERRNETWVFFPEEVFRAPELGAGERSVPYLPAPRGFVPKAISAELRSGVARTG